MTIILHSRPLYLSCIGLLFGAEIKHNEVLYSMIWFNMYDIKNRFLSLQCPTTPSCYYIIPATQAALFICRPCTNCLNKTNEKMSFAIFHLGTKVTPSQGIEPWSPAWQAGILATILWRILLSENDPLTHILTIFLVHFSHLHTNYVPTYRASRRVSVSDSRLRCDHYVQLRWLGWWLQR